MTVSLLPDRLCLLRFPREDLERCSHAILKHILFRDYSRQGREEPLFSYVDNSLEISIFGDAEAISRDFAEDVCPSIEISSHIYRALQVDNDDTFNSSRICMIVEPLAKAGVSIFYMSTYQTDLLFVQEDRLPVVFTTLSQHGLPIATDENFNNTPPYTPISGQRPSWGVKCDQSDDESAQPSSALGSHQAKYLSVHSLATPPGSRDSTSDYDDDDDDDDDGGDPDSAAAEGHPDVPEGSVQQLLPLDIVSAHQHGARGADKNGHYDDAPLAKASPTTTTAIEIRQQAVRTLPQNTLRCVGLNADLESGHQPWILKVIKILFYDDKIKEEAVHTGNGPKYDAPRFFSFTVTSECVSMITDTYILKEFEEHELFMDMETRPLRLIQLDLHRFGLDKYGIIHSVARPLTEAGIDLLYLSTFSTANILVAEHRLADAEKILSGGGTGTPPGGGHI